MKEITKFAQIGGTPSDLPNVLDAPGSSIDVVFAEAIIANKPTSILEENNIITVRSVPSEVDRIRFPIVRNTQFTWTEMDARTGSYAGSDVDSSALTAVEYRDVRPTVKTANVFLPDSVSLLNKVNFELYSQIGATEAQRKKEFDALALLGSPATITNLYAAGGFTSAGSTDAGSTLDPMDLVKTKELLMTGSDINKPDYAIMHPEQYVSLNTHADFAPGATVNGAMMRKAKFDENGDIVKFDGLDIFVTELLPSIGSTTLSGQITDDRYTVLGHPVIIGTRGLTIGRGEHMGIKVFTEDSRRFHGQFKIFDMSYEHTLLVQEALVNVVAANS